MKEALQARLADYVFVRVASELNEVMGSVTDENGNKIELALNPLWKPTHHARICGEVIAAPSYLNGKDGFVYENYVGSPKPLQYRGHESIKRLLVQMPGRNNRPAPYLCGSYEPDFQTLQGVSPEVFVGDLVYFHYNSLLNIENFAWRDDDGSLIYKLHYSTLFCAVRNGSIHMLNAYVLVSEISEEGVRVIDAGGVKTKGKLENGLVTTVDVNQWVKSGNGKIDKKTNTYEYGSKRGIGRLAAIGYSIGSDTRSVEIGSTVLFRRNSEFDNNIEGNKYFLMYQWDLVGVYDPELKPIGDYILIEPEVQKVSNANYQVYDGNKDQQDFKPGELFVLPTAHSQQKKNKIHKYGLGKVVGQGENVVNKTWDQRRVMYAKSGYYMFVEDKVLVRAGDVYGELI